MTQEPAHERVDHAPEPLDEEDEGGLDLVTRAEPGRRRASKRRAAA